MFAVLRAQPRGLAAVFRDLVGLLLFELRRDMGLGPALVGALLRILLGPRLLLFRLLVGFALPVGLLLFILFALLGRAGFSDFLLLRFLPGGLRGLLCHRSAVFRLSVRCCPASCCRSFVSAVCAASFFSRSARAKEARSLAVCLVPSAMVRPRGAGYPVRMPSVAILFVVRFVLPLLILLALPLLLLPGPPLLVILHLSLAIRLAVFFLGPVVQFL